MQSSLSNNALHVAIIMDGNGRWATRRGLPRAAGHRAGVETIRRVTDAAPALGIGTLTLFAFSADNWRRPPAEVDGLMGLLRRFLLTKAARFADTGVRFSVIGRRDRLPAGLAEQIVEAERISRGGGRLHLRIAIDYSSRDAILAAIPGCAANGTPTRGTLGHCLAGGADRADEVDLLIRTGGEQRLSDFLLWVCAYAELFFPERMWPDFTAADLAAIVAEFRRRDRRFGGLSGSALIDSTPTAA
jgi:undecaprenyl diphosphate synthase